MIKLNGHQKNQVNIERYMTTSVNRTKPLRIPYNILETGCVQNLAQDHDQIRRISTKGLI